MRRIILEEPLSRAAAWSRTCALFALTVATIGVLMARAGIDATAAMAVVGAAVIIAGAAVACAFAAVVVIWRTGFRGTGRLLAALLVAAAVLAYPGFVAVKAARAPRLSDVSTNPTDPPRFSASSQAVAARNGTALGPPSADKEALQRRVYPDLQPLLLDIDAAEAHRLILKIVAARHWTVIEDELPLGRFGVGRVDAVARTPIMGFPADVVIRIRRSGSQSAVDIRSVSRTPWQEPGSNAARVRALAADLDDQASDTE